MGRLQNEGIEGIESGASLQRRSNLFSRAIRPDGLRVPPMVWIALISMPYAGNEWLMAEDFGLVNRSRLRLAVRIRDPRAVSIFQGEVGYRGAYCQEA